ncbi:class I SAM-dependent methyltransferase [Bosea sp. Tri-44]|uniref:class I SAM-dependent methyltransferase n=1 Tax=Bosea sp. Tri-44 TaxID=1972137 RepID=UPI0019D6C482|nr:class I SAM-dependent methyltransferase [Bosea sp. Tri-44]
MAQRLQVVQRQIRTALDSSPSGALQIISLCAGQGRDLLEVLANHPRRNDVRARLVELDERNTAFAEQSARASGLHQVEVVTADASLTDQYRDMVPAHLVLICGVFGNITDEDIERTIDVCPQLCATGGSVIWTRHRRAPDRVPLICERFEARGFDLQWLSDHGTELGVGVHRFFGEHQPLATGRHMFKFVGYDKLGL